MEGYVAPVNCNVFIGNILLDDTAIIEYSISNHVEVYYGYNSRYFDAIADGRILVIGALTLNFRAISYLTRAITNSASVRNLNPEIIMSQDNSRLRANYDLTGVEDAVIDSVVLCLYNEKEDSYRKLKEGL